MRKTYCKENTNNKKELILTIRELLLIVLLVTNSQTSRLVDKFALYN